MTHTYTYVHTHAHSYSSGYPSRSSNTFTQPSVHLHIMYRLHTCKVIHTYSTNICIVCVCVYVCMYVFMYVCMHVCMYVFVCMYVMYICMYVYMYVCMYVMWIPPCNSCIGVTWTTYGDKTGYSNTDLP